MQLCEGSITACSKGRLRSRQYSKLFVQWVETQARDFTEVLCRALAVVSVEGYRFEFEAFEDKHSE